MHNVLVVHGGGPTAVINASLYGVLRESGRHPEIARVYGAVGGTRGVLEENFVDLCGYDQAQCGLLLQTPASALGSSRFPLYEKEYQQMKAICKKYDIGSILFNGGNGTMDACGHLYQLCEAENIRVIGIPKTIDNDIAMTDHCPGYGSAARYIAATVREIAEDVRSLPIHVCIVEAMGRNAGWITAAAAMAEAQGGYGPDLIYVPERCFDEAAFLKKVGELYERQGYVVVAASEGLRAADGNSIVPPIFKTERAVYYGDVGAYLAELVIKKLGIKARSEKPGIAGRASVALSSSVDREEAILAGEFALRAAESGKSGYMVGFQRAEGPEYRMEPTLVPLDKVMLYERKLPDEFIREDGMGVTEAFKRWCRPLLGEPFPEFFRLK